MSGTFGTEPTTLTLVVMSVLTSVDVRLTSDNRSPDEIDGTVGSVTHSIFIRFTSNFVHLHPLSPLQERVLSRFSLINFFLPKFLLDGNLTKSLMGREMCIYPYISPQHVCICIRAFVFVPHMQDWSEMYHDVCTQYLFTVVIKGSHVLLLFHLLVNCLRVEWIDCLYVCRVCFDCTSHQWCEVDVYCYLHCLRVVKNALPP